MFRRNSQYFQHWLSLCTLMVCNANAAPLDIPTAYQLAQKNAPSITISQYGVAVAEADRDIARAKSLPQVSIFGQWSENSIDYESAALSQFQNQRYPGERYGIQARQSLFNLANWRETNMRTASLREAKQNMLAAEATLLTQISANYLTALLADADLALLTDELKSLDQQLDEAKAFHERSLLPITQLLETQARTDAVRASVIEAKGAAAVARENLIQLIGLRDFSLIGVNAAMSLMPSVNSVEEGIRVAVEQNPRLEAAREALEAARFDIGRAKGTRLPEISLSLNSQYSDVGFDNLTSPPRTSESIQISVNMPLLEGGAGMARVRRAWADYYSREAELKAVRREIEAEVRETWLNFQTATERVIAARQALASADVNLKAVEKSTSLGATRFTDVLIALAQVTRAHRDLSSAEYSRVQSWLGVELATGQSPSLLAKSLGRTVHRKIRRNAELSLITRSLSVEQ